MTAKLEAFVFDVFGTVVDWRSGIAQEVTASGLIGPDAERAFEFADAWRRRYVPSFIEVNSGRRPFAKLDALHFENLLETLLEFGVDPLALPEAALTELNHAWHRLPPWPDSVRGLALLKSRFVIAPHSNGNLRLLLDMAKHGGLPWDAILGAEVVGAYKPVPQSYLRTAELLSLRPDQVCMVAAHNDDLAAARACGLRTAFVLRPHEHGPRQTTDLAPTQDWDFVVNSIAELGEIACASPG
ncbi:haloacid dehalogenase type II [Chelatococcus reniformis]|uniref:(S)-2-haloacid dehalogenase n=1 Tax=Chelatococcus reniformis TaxID=1494448 RepID=A0A916U0H7_9HYPH|nr:haloacid dehalogenase type II [Chelatococcus reniformis]GGC55506.1 haloacid dehalogenase [Chelatococcus reniformis]